jgi:hypothetical protein
MHNGEMISNISPRILYHDYFSHFCDICALIASLLKRSLVAYSGLSGSNFGQDTNFRD